ncbi:MAG: XRE family transcriptional regulator [Rhodospirillaceae bacterium]|nr:MAG: XRE family transcriptional regulator [Rhodospirillaceae bacterium]
MENQEIWTAEDLVAWRKTLGWTQTKAATELGISLRAYQDREAGKARITREAILACGALRHMAARAN